MFEVYVVSVPVSEYLNTKLNNSSPKCNTCLE